jgi:cystathionine gamma-synthase
MFAIAPSLGEVESIVTQPVTSTHRGLDPERAARGIADNMIQLSVGLIKYLGHALGQGT